jgi:Icc-related predicted phosphoesterase
MTVNNMKTVFIGDIHGRDTWKQIVETESDADKFVFVGDYFDSFDISGVIQLHNFKEIIEFKKSSDKEVVLLFGNHDYHYMPGYSGMGYSGYQAGLAWQFKEAIQENLEHLQMAHLHDNILCSHAGVSWIWLENKFGKSKDESMYGWHCDNLEGVKNIVDLINDYFKSKPNIFEFNGWNPYGDNVYQTPIWIRPASLLAANKDTSLKKRVIQIVGHTGVSDIFQSVKASKKSMGGKYYMIDALASNGYLVYDNNKFIPKALA